MNNDLNSSANNGECICFEDDMNISTADKIKLYAFLGGITFLATYGATKIACDVSNGFADFISLRRAAALDRQKAKLAEEANIKTPDNEN